MKPELKRDVPFWAECHLDEDINEPADVSDIVSRLRDSDPEFTAIALDDAL